MAKKLLSRGKAPARELFEADDPEPTIPPGEVVILPPADVCETLRAVTTPVTVTHLDPWYNKGVGGVQDGYDDWLAGVIALAGKVSDHVYVWGFPEIIYRQLDRLTPDLSAGGMADLVLPELPVGHPRLAVGAVHLSPLL